MSEFASDRNLSAPEARRVTSVLPSRPFKALAAMALNRVIGVGKKIPWHLPEDFKWFKKTTTDHIIVMGRKTFESIGRPLPNRTTIVVSRSVKAIPGVQVVGSVEAILEAAAAAQEKQVFICGGAELDRQTLPLCSDLFLTLVKREVEGDTFFPKFENEFCLISEILDRPEFKILHYAAR